MLLLVSGEGVTDMGRCIVSDQCSGQGFEAGPMAWLVDQIVEARMDYSVLSVGLMTFVSESRVSKRSKSLKPMTLAGRKRKQETTYFFRNARAMAKLAQELAKKENDEVVAVLFRDTDRTRSSKRGEWQDKWDAMVKGFAVEGFNSGVPMLPNPKSEAWLLCALKSQPYENCDRIEAESGNDDAPNSLKAQLGQVLGQTSNAAMLTDLVRTKKVDASRIDMSSFNRFRNRLQKYLASVS